MPNLEDYDIDEHLPSNVNTSYHTLQDLSTLSTSENDFSLFHMNRRSVSYHFDELISTLASLKINFDVIGVSETWNSFENPIKTNVDIPGYRNFSNQSHSQNCGVGLYVKSGLNSTHRPDLGKDSSDFETVWVKVETETGKIICFVVHIVIQAQILTVLLNIYKKFCPIQLYLVNKFFFLEISMLTC